ncbi:MAG: TonB-dependent receptor domain-containing protein [Butyricimonas virosa]
MTDGSSLGYNGNITLNYNTLFGEKHILYAGIGCEVKQDDSNSHGFTLTGFPDDRYSDPAFAIQFKENSRATSDESKSRSIGFFANGNYIYDDRYFADVSVRIDGSSKFGVDKRFAPFWSVGAGWNVHNEKFFKSTKVSMLKLRYSYGNG